MIWFCDKLEYAALKALKVVIAQHLPFSVNGVEITESPFSVGENVNYNNYGYRYDDSNNDVIADIVNAFVQKESTKNYHFIPKTIKYNSVIDNTTSIPSFDFSYDFSGLKDLVSINIKAGRFSINKTYEDIDDVHTNGLIFLCGHWHRGGLCAHSEYGLKQLMQDSGRVYVGDVENNRVGKSLDPNNICFDHLNVLTILDSKIHITRLGSEYVNRISNDEIISRNNKIIEL